MCIIYSTFHLVCLSGVPPCCNYILDKALKAECVIIKMLRQLVKVWHLTKLAFFIET